MNPKQKTVLGLTGVVLLLMLAFPPFEYLTINGVPYRNAGYGFVFLPPAYQMDNGNGTFKLKTAAVSYKMLLIQFAVAAAIGGIGVAMRKD